MDYLTLNAAETAALVRAIDGADVRSVQLSRRDAFDNPWPEGTLIVSVVTSDDQTRYAISTVGLTVEWGQSMPRLTVDDANAEVRELIARDREDRSI